MFARNIGRMSSKSLAAQRTRAIARHMMSTSAKLPPTPKPQDIPNEPPVLFESNGHTRKYILNRPKKLNALDDSMLNILRPYAEEWSRSQLTNVLIGTGAGRAFCAGGDVAYIAQNAINPETRPKSIDFFRREFELDYILAAVPHPYVVVMDGITMGGGVGLSSHAAFRIATENTVFAMPETKIGYSPDVGGSHFLSKLDGEIGTYLGLTGETLKGRAVFEHGFATHFVPSRRIPALLERLAALDQPTFALIDSTIEEAHSEREPGEPVSPLVGELRIALDSAFRHDTVEAIVKDLETISGTHELAEVREWAKHTLEALDLRSPTSLKVALLAIRKGKTMSLLQALQMEMNFATAFCSGETSDFNTGVDAVVVAKSKERPGWIPKTLDEVDITDVEQRFFNKYTPEEGTAPALTVPDNLQGIQPAHPMRHALPTEEEIGIVVTGQHRTSSDTGITRQELFQRVEILRPGKHGLREKLQEVLTRKCTEEKDDAGQLWLKWIH